MIEIVVGVIVVSLVVMTSAVILVSLGWLIWKILDFLLPL